MELIKVQEEYDRVRSELEAAARQRVDKAKSATAAS